MEDEVIDGEAANDETRLRGNIQSALLKMEKAQLILNDIETAYLKIEDRDPEIFPEVKAEYQRIEALLNMLFDFLTAGKSELDEVTEIIGDRKKE